MHLVFFESDSSVTLSLSSLSFSFPRLSIHSCNQNNVPRQMPMSPGVDGEERRAEEHGDEEKKGQKRRRRWPLRGTHGFEILVSSTAVSNASKATQRGEEAVERVHVRTETRKRGQKRECTGAPRKAFAHPGTPTFSRAKGRKKNGPQAISQLLLKSKVERKKTKVFLFFLPRTTSLAPPALSLRVASRATPFCLRTVSKPEARRVVSSSPLAAAAAALPSSSSSTDVDPDATKKKTKMTSLPLPPTASGTLGASHPSHARDWENPAVTERNRWGRADDRGGAGKGQGGFFIHLSELMAFVCPVDRSISWPQCSPSPPPSLAPSRRRSSL